MKVNEYWNFNIDQGGTFTDIIGIAPDKKLIIKKVLTSKNNKSYNPVIDGITKVKKEYSLILDELAELEKDEKVKRLNDFVRKYRDVKGTSEFKKNVSKAIKELKKKKVKEDRVEKSLEKARKEINDLEVWVLGSKTTLASSLETYLDKTKTTLGVRAQPKFQKELALYLASCNANHRDLSLYF